MPKAEKKKILRLMTSAFYLMSYFPKKPVKIIKNKE